MQAQWCVCINNTFVEVHEPEPPMLVRASSAPAHVECRKSVWPFDETMQGFNKGRTEEEQGCTISVASTDAISSASSTDTISNIGGPIVLENDWLLKTSVLQSKKTTINTRFQLPGLGEILAAIEPVNASAKNERTASSIKASNG